LAGQSFPIPTGSRTYEIQQEISVPSDIDPGDYHKFLLKVGHTDLAVKWPSSVCPNSENLDFVLQTDKFKVIRMWI